MTIPGKAFTDPETLRTISLDAIDALVNRYRSASSDVQRRTIANQLMIFGVSLKRINDELEKKVNVGMDMLLAADPEREHEDDPRIDMWMQWKVDYEAVCDRLSAIENGVLRGRWDLVSTRSTVEVEASRSVEAA
jgi:hypothetical protein